MSLFEQTEKRNQQRAQPLAAKMRPQTLADFVGQTHLLAPGRLLRQLMEADRLGSLIFYGPPGTGKTTLARLLAGETKRQFVSLSAIMHGVKELREVLQQARDNLATGGQGTLLFIDEIHRFNRAQQDALLADVEEGVISLIGATTSNPSFAVNNALLSRSHLFQFEPLSEFELVDLINRAVQDPQRGLGNLSIGLTEDGLRRLCQLSDGDGRKTLAILETAVIAASGGNTGNTADVSIPAPNHPKLANQPSAPAQGQSSPTKIVLEAHHVQAAAGNRAFQYDGSGDEHYDCASALIKSIRGSDPDAGLYWLARMLEGGEDVRFLCRRLVILASEDVGNADPQALPMAVACFQACEQIGLPECQLTLSQTVTYLACAPKSNAATLAIAAAREDVRNHRVLPVPQYLRDSHYRSAKKMGAGVGYQYSHQEDDGVASQDYLGIDRIYYHPVDRGFEQELRARLDEIRTKLSAAKSPPREA